MKYLVFILVVGLLSVFVSAQEFADKEYYLVDSLDFRDVNPANIDLINHHLNQFHKASNDTSKINEIALLVEECWDDNIWSKYNAWLFSFISIKMNDNSKLSDKELYFYKKNYAITLNNYGYLSLLHDSINKSILFYEESISIDRDIDNKKGIANTLNNLGLSYSKIGQISKGLEFYKEALKINKTLNDKKAIALTLNNIGGVYQELNYIDEALKYFESSLNISEEIKDQRSVANALHNLGKLQALNHNYKKALQYFMKSLAVFKSLDQSYGLSLSFYNIGNVYGRLNNLDSSLFYFKKALNLQLDKDYKSGIVRSLIALGNIDVKLNNIDVASVKYSKAYKISKTIGIPELISTSANKLSVVSKRKGNYSLALQFYKEYIKMKDSITNDDVKKEVLKKDAQYIYEKQKALDDATHEKELALEQEAKKRQQIITVAVTSGLALVVLFLMFVYRRLQITKKQKVEIEVKKAEVEQQKVEIEAINEQLEEVSKEISDSINYAEMIQQAVLPSLELEDLKNEAFIYFNPKDRVSGDFYWLEQKGEYSGYCVADCTGHGIPGAFISMVGTILLNEIHNSKGINIPNQILDELSRLVKLTLTNKDGYTMKDGMDMSFVLLNNKTKVLHFSAANNPIWMVSSEPQKNINKEMVNPTFEKGGKYIYEIKGDKQPIGDYGDMAKPFTLHNAQLVEGDCFYLFSDGYVDQFGGERNKKFKAKAFRELLVAVNSETMEQQHKVLEQNFLDWKQDTEQIDDVTVMGVRV